MFAALLVFIRPFALPLALAGLVGVTAYSVWTRIELALVRHEVGELQRDVGSLKVKLAGADAVIERQRASIADMKAKGVEAQKAVDAARAEAKRQRKAQEDRVRAILATKVPKSCTAAVEWGAAQAPEVVKGWAK